MVTITQLAVSLAFDLGLQKDVAPHMLRHSNSIQRRFRQPAKQQTRTIEERRTMIALFHLTSSYVIFLSFALVLHDDGLMFRSAY